MNHTHRILILSAFCGLLFFTGCGEEPVEGKPAVGYGVEAPKKTSPINNQLPPPEPLAVPDTEND